MKKLAAIYNLFDGLELLPGSMACLKDHVDIFIILWQNVSNFGEEYDGFHKLLSPDNFAGVDLNRVYLLKFDPRPEIGGLMNERAKRIMGVDAALNLGCSHFLHIDCDEYYEDFGAAKEEYLMAGKRGSVLRLWAYFKKPTLRVDKPEDYHVPFIHELTPQITVGSSSYPFWADPTRVVNESDVAELSAMMHHYTWVRKDIEMKCRNSSAIVNVPGQKIENWGMLRDYRSANVGPGFYVNDWQRTLVQVPDLFNLSPIFEETTNK